VVTTVEKVHFLRQGTIAHKLTREERIRGGKASSLEKKLVNRKKCNSRCPLYPCHIIYLKEKDECILNVMPKDKKVLMLRMIAGEHSELVHELNTGLIEILVTGRQILRNEDNPKRRFHWLEHMQRARMNVNKALYGEGTANPNPEGEDNGKDHKIIYKLSWCNNQGRK